MIKKVLLFGIQLSVGLWKIKQKKKGSPMVGPGIEEKKKRKKGRGLVFTEVKIGKRLISFKKTKSPGEGEVRKSGGLLGWKRATHLLEWKNRKDNTASLEKFYLHDKYIELLGWEEGKKKGFSWREKFIHIEGIRWFVEIHSIHKKFASVKQKNLNKSKYLQLNVWLSVQGYWEFPKRLS